MYSGGLIRRAPLKSHGLVEHEADAGVVGFHYETVDTMNPIAAIAAG
jgi:hypothetical protein